PSGAVLGTRDGSIWFGARDGLNRLNNGQFTVYRERRGGAPAGTRAVPVSGLPKQGLESLFQDSRGRIWVSAQIGVGYLENGRFVSMGVPGGFTSAFAEDSAGNLWVANQDVGLIRLSPDSRIQQIPWATFGHKETAGTLAADPVLGGLWLGFFNGGIAYYRDGQVRVSYSAADGLGEGRVSHLRFDGEGALWASTSGGLSRLKNGR